MNNIFQFFMIFKIQSPDCWWIKNSVKQKNVKRSVQLNQEWAKRERMSSFLHCLTTPFGIIAQTFWRTHLSKVDVTKDRVFWCESNWICRAMQNEFWTLERRIVMLSEPRKKKDKEVSQKCLFRLSLSRHPIIYSLCWTKGSTKKISTEIGGKLVDVVTLSDDG